MTAHDSVSRSIGQVIASIRETVDQTACHEVRHAVICVVAGAGARVPDATDSAASGAAWLE